MGHHLLLREIASLAVGHIFITAGGFEGALPREVPALGDKRLSLPQRVLFAVGREITRYQWQVLGSGCSPGRGTTVTWYVAICLRPQISCSGLSLIGRTRSGSLFLTFPTRLSTAQAFNQSEGHSTTKAFSSSGTAGSSPSHLGRRQPASLQPLLQRTADHYLRPDHFFFSMFIRSHILQRSDCIATVRSLDRITYRYPGPRHAETMPVLRVQPATADSIHVRGRNRWRCRSRHRHGA